MSSVRSTKLLSNLSYNSAFSVLANIFPLLTVPYLTRTLTTSSLGEVFFYLSLSKTITIFCLLGIPIYGVKIIAQSKNINEREQLISNLIHITFILFTIVSIIGGLYYIFFPFEITPFQVILYAMILSGSFSLEWVVQGMERFKFLATRNFIIRTITLILIFSFVKNEDDGIIYFSILAAASLILAIANIKLVFNTNSILLKKIKIVRKHLKPIFILFGSIVAVSLYTSFDTILLERLSDLDAVARYNVAMKTSLAATMIITSISAVFLPLASANYKTNLYNEVIDISIKISIIFGGLILIGLFSYSTEIIEIIGGDKYVKDYYLLIILSFNPLIIGLSQIFGLQMLTVEGKESKFLYAVSMGAAISIFLNLLLIPIFSAAGAAIANLLAELTVLIGCIVLGRYKLKLLFTREIIFIELKLLLLAVIIQIFRHIMIYLDLNTLILIPLILIMIYLFFYNKIIKTINKLP